MQGLYEVVIRMSTGIAVISRLSWDWSLLSSSLTWLSPGILSSLPHEFFHREVTHTVISAVFCLLEWVIKYNMHTREGGLNFTFWRKEIQRMYGPLSKPTKNIKRRNKASLKPIKNHQIIACSFDSYLVSKC